MYSDRYIIVLMRISTKYIMCLKRFMRRPTDVVKINPYSENDRCYRQYLEIKHIETVFYKFTVSVGFDEGLTTMCY